ncbi:galactose-6-phosphate isomerase subunit LacB [Sporolactobacillus spathodeae]|uniref:Galactose-6-phosphate isomerase n=1 Tax=Sporolactobacillus spathodeae TaxID=1465502 RepID=A0ABS2Q8J5_9BACL|nr:galactose-6-phosphate isomerase subunit LacB [Sporolactobacillus spathodeae]MBM7657282.1 galactose-6-phosphate isomerase [Sporolactobacillus spathodeae]
MTKTVISIGCDHIVTDIKERVSEHLKEEGYEVIDNGTYDKLRTHYPIYGKKTAEKVVSGEAAFGVVLCGTGVGISSSAAKVPNARVALVRDVSEAEYARKTLNANVVAVGGHITGVDLIKAIVDKFITTDYEETPEHEALIKKINALEGPKPEQTGNEHFFDEFEKKWEEGYYHD